MSTTRRRTRSQVRATDPVLVALGERVRDLRAVRGMSRKMLARDAGVSERFLADLETGVGNASVLLLSRLAQALALPLAALLTIEAEPRVELSRLAARDLRVKLLDRSISPAIQLEPALAVLEVASLGFGGKAGAYADTLAEVRVELAVPGLLAGAGVEGELFSQAGPPNLSAVLAMSAVGLTPSYLDAWLAPLGLRSEMESGALAASLTLSARAVEDGFEASASLSEASLKDRERFLASVHGIEVKELAVGAEGTHLARMHIERERGRL